jgi:hypothetical protein
MSTGTFAHYPGEPEEVTADHVAALEREREFRDTQGASDLVKQIDAELYRIRGDKAGRQTRLRGDVGEAA